MCEFAAFAVLRSASASTVSILQLHLASHPELVAILAMLPPALSIYTYNKLKCWHISRATPQSPFWRGGYGVTDTAIANWDSGFGEITGKLGFVAPFTFFAKLFKVGTKEFKDQQRAATAANTARGKIQGKIQGPLRLRDGTGIFDKKYDDKRQEWGSNGGKKGKGVKMGKGKKGTKVS